MCKNSEIERNDEQPLLERLEAYGRTDVYPTICMNRKAS